MKLPFYDETEAKTNYFRICEDRCCGDHRRNQSLERQLRAEGYVNSARSCWYKDWEICKALES